MKRLVLSIIFIVFYSLVRGQGCSDAGFCTLAPFKPEPAHENDFKNQIKLGLSIGAADHNVGIWGTHFEYSRTLNPTFAFNLKITSLAQSGNGVSVNGLSDIFINANYAATERLKFTGGVKIPLMNGNLAVNGLPLPMDYQSSLGTFDAIAGASYSFNNLQAVLAFQIPLSQNSNAFHAEDYSSNSFLNVFQSTNGFVRRADVLLRLSYPIKMQSRLTLTPGLLPIYHLGNDEYTDLLNRKVEIKGSQGLTLNATLFLDYQIGRKGSVQASFGTPLVTRDSRPDGLTRSFLATFEYSIRF